MASMKVLTAAIGCAILFGGVGTAQAPAAEPEDDSAHPGAAPGTAPDEPGHEEVKDG
jgi:hypothetical protein